MDFHFDAILFLSGISSLLISPVATCEGQQSLAAQLKPDMLYSTGYPASYINSAACSWVIFSAESGARVYVELVEVHLDDSNNDCVDSLSMHDGFDSRGQLLLRVCGQMTRTIVKSSPGQTMYISFSSDATRTGKGFALRIWAAQEASNHPSCVPGTVQTLTVTTPQRLDLPDTRAGVSVCNFRLEASDNSVLVLRPVPGASGLLDCETENIRIYDGINGVGPSVQLWCNGTDFTSYRSSGRYLYLQTSLSRTSKLSFMVHRELRLPDECSAMVFPQIDVPYSAVYLWMPYTYDIRARRCTVSAGFRSVGSSSQLSITVLGTAASATLNCSINYLQVSSYSDTMDFLHKPKCTPEGLPYYSGSGPNLVLGPAVMGRGVRYLLEIQAQGYRCESDTTLIEIKEQNPVTWSIDVPTPQRAKINIGFRVPETYRNELEVNFALQASWTPCTFRFKAVKDDHLVKIVFKDSNLKQTGGTACTRDYFRVYDGHNQSSSSLGEYCGQGWSRPPVYTSTSDELFVELIANITGGYIHIEIEYSSFEDNRCNGTAEFQSTERDQFIPSPAYPNSLAGNLQCLYMVRSLFGNPIIVELTDFVFPADCSDNLTVFDGNSTSSPVLGLWCDSANTTLTTTGPTVLVMLSSRSHSTNSKFRVRYVDNAPKFGSPDDPRVPIAIGAIVGLANGAGGVFLLVFAICYCRNSSLKQEDEKTLEEKLEDMEVDQKEAASIEKDIQKDSCD